MKVLAAAFLLLAGQAGAAPLFGKAEIEGRLDGRAIGMTEAEPFRLIFETDETGFATAELFMDQSGNNVADYGLEYFYEGDADHGRGLPGDRFAGDATLVPSVASFGKIISNHSLGWVGIEVEASPGVLWDGAPGTIDRLTARLGFFGLDRDADAPEYYDIDRSKSFLLTATSFDRFRFVAGDGQSRDLAPGPQPAPVPLPQSAWLLGAAVAGLSWTRRRRDIAA